MHALYSALTGKSDTILDMYDYGGISFIEEKKVDSSYFSSIFGKKKTEYINTAPYWAKYSIKQGLVNAKEGAGVGFLAGGFFAYTFLKNPSPYTPIETHFSPCCRIYSYNNHRRCNNRRQLSAKKCNTNSFHIALNKSI